MAISSNFPTTRPSLILDFQKSEVVDPRITFTRTSSATRFNQYGVLETVANNVPRIDFSPTTLLCNGLLTEEQRTNSIRNNTMQGAVAGTPGTLPTNWFVFTPATGLTTSVVGTGIDNGISYTDVRVTGTASGGGNIIWGCESNAGVAALNGQTWAQSTYLKIQGGTTAGIVDFRIQNDERSASAYIRTNASSALPLTTAALNTQRYSFAATLSGGGTVAHIVPYVLINFTVGVAIDITLRIGLPQLEQGAFATSVIPTTNAAVTRNTDFANITGTNFSSWYNASEGTLFTQAQDMSDAAHATSQPRVASINNGTNSAIDTSRAPASAQARARVDDAGVNQFNSLTTAWPLAAQAKIALAYKLNDSAACLGGTTVFTDNAITIPTVNTLTIGNYSSGGPNVWVGWIQRVVYYPVRLTNAQLQALTLT